MKKNLLVGLISFLVGVLFLGAVVFFTAPKLMLIESESRYDFETTVEKFEQSVKSHNWKIPTIHDLQKTMKKYGKKVDSVKVYELCHPDHAEKILKEGDERIVSSLMPCRIAIYKKPDGKTYVSRLNSSLMSKMIGGIIEDVMTEAAKENEEILLSVIK